LKNLKKLKEYVRERATEKSSAALFRYEIFLFIIFNFSIVLFKNNDKIKLLSFTRRIGLI